MRFPERFPRFYRYDFSVAYQMFHKLVRWVARKYAVKGDYRMSREDLEAEGFLTMVRCCQSFPGKSSFPERNLQFARYFKKALYGKIIKLRRFRYQGKRNGVEVELSELLSSSTCPTKEVESELDLRLLSMKRRLSGNGYAVLELMAYPDKKVLDIAWQDFCRKNKANVQGKDVKGWKRFRIRPRHVFKSLGILKSERKRITREIRAIAKLLYGGKRTNGKSKGKGKARRERRKQEEKEGR